MEKAEELGAQNAFRNELASSPKRGQYFVAKSATLKIWENKNKIDVCRGPKEASGIVRYGTEGSQSLPSRGYEVPHSGGTGLAGAEISERGK